MVRVSGPQALSIVQKHFRFKNPPETHRVYYGDFFKEESIIDEVLVSYFEQGRSFTGEEVLEISSHGSPIILDEIVQTLILGGCRLADRGEFTFRAYMNDRIDLVQAEGVLSLIESTTSQAREVALKHLKGGLSQEVFGIQKSLEGCLAHLEAEIDFSHENLETMNYENIRNQVQRCLRSATELASSYTVGKMISDSMRVVLLGEPNVGKSSLFNALVGQERAIVTPVAGTTRDTVEASVIRRGYKVRFIDTAGVHDTQDSIEKIGISKTKSEISEADLILCVLDLSLKSNFDFSLLKGLSHKTVFVGNKDDIKSVSYSDFLKENMPKHKYIEVSAVQKNSLDKIWDVIDEQLVQSPVETSLVVLKQRQFELLEGLKTSLEKTLMAIQDKLSPEFVAVDLRVALSNSMEILGERLDDQVLTKIFQEFCIGK